MKYVDEAMKNLQQAAHKLDHLDFDQNKPWEALQKMQNLFDEPFWEQIQQLHQYANTNHKGNHYQHTQGTHGTNSSSKSKHKQPGSNWKDSRDRRPPIDIFQTKSRLIVCCEIPGLDRNSLKLSLSEGNRLQIKGKIKAHDFANNRKFIVQQERFQGNFVREIELPVPVKANEIRKQYKNGILELLFSYLSFKRNEGDIY